MPLDFPKELDGDLHTQIEIVSKIPDITSISKGLLGQDANFSSPQVAKSLAVVTDEGVRSLITSQMGRYGMPRVGGMFFETVETFRGKPIAQNEVFADVFAKGTTGLSLTSSTAGYIKNGPGMGMVKVMGGMLSRVTGPALKSISQGMDMFKGLWDALPVEAIPFVGAIIDGFVSMLTDAIGNKQEWRELDYAKAMPEYNNQADAFFANNMLSFFRGSDDKTPIWSPPGPCLYDPDSFGDRYIWNWGFDDILVKDEGDRLWFAYGSVSEGGYRPEKLAPYALDPSFYGRSAPLAYGCIPGLAKVHMGFCGNKKTAFELGQYFPTAANVGSSLWYQISNPANPLIWYVWPDKLYDRWLDYLAGLRRGIHLSLAPGGLGGAPDAKAPRYMNLVKYGPQGSGKKKRPIYFNRDVRKQMVAAGQRLFGWRGWCDEDEKLFQKSKDGEHLPAGIDYYVDKFRLTDTDVARAIIDLKINQYGAAELVTCAYARENCPALMHNSDLRDKVFDNKKKLLTSEKLHLVDEDMVEEKELQEAIKKAKANLAQQSMKELWSQPDPDQVLEKEVRASRMRDMLIEETPISAAVTGQKMPQWGLKKPSKKGSKKKKSSSAGLGIAAAAAAGVVIMRKK